MLLKTKPSQIFSLPKDLKNPEDQLLEGFVQCPLFEKKRIFEGHEGIFHKFSAHSTYKGKEFFGYGCDIKRKQAASKAVGELLERMAVFEFFEQRENFLKSSLSPRNLEFKDEKINSQKTSLDLTNLPPGPFYSSNGWAVHFYLEKALENAALEALERHILILTYLKYGWKGFFTTYNDLWKGREVWSLLSRITLGGFQGAMTFIKSKYYKGGSFGFLCEKTSQLNRSPKWQKAFFESLDPLEVYETRGFCEKGAMEKQRDHLIHTSPPTWNQTKKSLLEEVQSLKAQALLFDLQKNWNLPFPLFATFVHGKDLIPLFFKDMLSPLEQKWLLSKLKTYKLYEIPSWHPVI